MFLIDLAWQMAWHHGCLCWSESRCHKKTWCNAPKVKN